MTELNLLNDIQANQLEYNTNILEMRISSKNYLRETLLSIIDEIYECFEEETPIKRLEEIADIYCFFCNILNHFESTINIGKHQFNDFFKPIEKVTRYDMINEVRNIIRHSDWKSWNANNKRIDNFQLSQSLSVFHEMLQFIRVKWMNKQFSKNAGSSSDMRLIFFNDIYVKKLQKNIEKNTKKIFADHGK